MGQTLTIDELMKRFEAEERYSNKLPATNAAHSMAVDPILDDFEAFARQTGNELMESKEEGGKFLFLIKKV